jgi:hypothetical protein
MDEFVELSLSHFPRADEPNPPLPMNELSLRVRSFSNRNDQIPGVLAWLHATTCPPSSLSYRASHDAPRFRVENPLGSIL